MCKHRSGFINNEYHSLLIYINQLYANAPLSHAWVTHEFQHYHKQMVLWICSDVQMENSSQLVGNVMALFSALMEVMKQIAVSSSVAIVDSFNAYCMYFLG